MAAQAGNPSIVNREKVIACVGMGEPELAHMRLLLRACASELHSAWRFGDETSPDLLVADTRNFAGEMAVTRARGAGIPCAVFTDAPGADDSLVLRRPLQRANLVEVLNSLAGSGMRTDVGAADEEFYVRDLGIGMVEPREMPVDEIAAGLDEALRARPRELRDEDVVEAARPAPEAPMRRASDAPVRVWATREAMLEETAQRPMREYLGSELLRGPSRVVLGDAPPLVFDPKHRMGYIAGGLHAAESYVRSRWRLCDWVPLKSSDLARAREELVPLPYSRLTWLDVLLHSGGHLARHLDPKASFRLVQWVEVDANYGWVFRIATAMLQPMRLHEITAASSATMADVFDVVNAYDAIGLIEARSPIPGEHERPPRSLFGRFR